MEIIDKKILLKLRKKNLGNRLLVKAIDKLVQQIEHANWETEIDIQDDRPDADRVHNDGFYIFNIRIHRTMILISIEEDLARILWVGTHQEYSLNFQNNKKTIEKWLRSRNEIK